MGKDRVFGVVYSQEVTVRIIYSSRRQRAAVHNSQRKRRLAAHCTNTATVIAATAIALFAHGGNAPAAEVTPSSAILQDLRSFREMGTVLYIAAHPDDENTQLITYFARGRGFRTAYLSVTRGDGGQNAIGNEFGDELGVIRTQELLAARRIDGGRQFFTRAIDFGFSKDARETLKIWDRQEVVSDIVRIMRSFRPDVVITRFSPQPGGTHGHHTSSAILAIEAFKVAGDTKAFPDQLTTLKPWQPKRILQNGGGFFGRRSEDTNNPPLQLDISGTDPVLGVSFGDIAGRSRSMHKTQGFGNFTGFGGRGGGGRAETFTLLAGEPATKDVFDGVDTTWNRISGGAQVGQLADEAIAKFDPKDPGASVPTLLKLRSLVATLPKDPLVDDKSHQLDRILQYCLALEVSTTVPDAEVVPGEVLKMRHTAILNSEYPVRWLGVRYPSLGRGETNVTELRPQQPVSHELAQTLPADTPLSQPYWLRQEHSTGMYHVDDPSLIGRPENPPVFPVEFIFEVGTQALVVADEPVQLTTAPAKGETRRRLDAIPPASLRLLSEVRLFAPGAERPIEVEVTAARSDTAGTLQLDVPAGWRVAPPSQSFKFSSAGQTNKFSFKVTAPPQPVTANLQARAIVNGKSYSNERIEIRYEHIPVQLLQPPARLKAVTLELAIRGHQVGYVPGAGDSIAESLEEMGYTVTRLSGADLTEEKLRPLDAVVIGVRAFNVRHDLEEHMPTLFSYVEAGGNVIVQYNRPTEIKVAPFDLRISNERVTDETAPVTLLAPEHAALNTPNKITGADFDGWIQERGLYFPNHWDDHFTPLIACSDPDEAPLKGGLLVAKDGRGYYVYTGLAWFRQLPAGVPGAYRLFANLVSLGK